MATAWTWVGVGDKRFPVRPWMGCQLSTAVESYTWGLWKGVCNELSSLISPSSRQTPGQLPSPFVREADMLLPLLQGAAKGVMGGLGEPFFEVQTLHGIADVVFAVVDWDVMSQRSLLGLPAVTELSAVATLMALRTSKDEGSCPCMQTTALAARTGISAGHLRSTLLPRLVESGWVSPERNGWALRAEFIPPVKSMTAVEIKRSDWKRALSQANAYTDFSDSAYVAMDYARVRDTKAMIPSFTFTGVGLVTIRSNAEANIMARIIAPKRRRRRGLAHSVVAERVAALIERDTRSGDVGLVFGRVLTTTSGLDPRLSQSARASVGELSTGAGALAR